MSSIRTIIVLAAAVFSLAAADPDSTDKPWTKPVREWTADDARRIMTNSPWAKRAMPAVDRSIRDSPRSRGGAGRDGGISAGGIGIGLPGIGGLGRRGSGYPSGDDPAAGRRTDTGPPPVLTLRWESALPVREAELKGRDIDAPEVDENHYAIAVIGVPRNLLSADAREADLMKQAALKRDGQKDLKPSRVQVLDRDDGPVIVYYFPRSTEISRSDRRVEFEAQIGRLKFSEPFYIEDMVYDGKPAL